ncbi:hypothetical protein IIM_04988 [Bacillus cereus VD107]|nr:hypothetical protein IIM_04988 [Bacillus cereus VD107]
MQMYILTTKILGFIHYESMFVRVFTSILFGWGFIGHRKKFSVIEGEGELIKDGELFFFKKGDHFILPNNFGEPPTVEKQRM